MASEVRLMRPWMSRFVVDFEPGLLPPEEDNNTHRILRAERCLARSSLVLRSAEAVLSRAEARLERSHRAAAASASGGDGSGRAG